MPPQCPQCYCGIEVGVQQGPGFLCGEPLCPSLPCTEPGQPTPVVCPDPYRITLHFYSSSLHRLVESFHPCSAWVMHNSQQAG